MYTLPRMQLIDIGINLTHASFDADRAAVLERAQEAGVTQLIITGATIPSSEHAIDCDRQALTRLRELLMNPEVVAVGECGLDYYRNYSPAAKQREVFTLQLALAAECGKPLFLHQRDAHQDFIAALREHRSAAREPQAALRGVAHCFTGGEDELAAYLELGLHIGITGWICDERRGKHLKGLVAQIPSGRLLLETDGPYLVPRDLLPSDLVPLEPKSRQASRRNEPKYLPHIAATVAALRGETLEACAAHTTAAAQALFGFGPPPSER